MPARRSEIGSVRGRAALLPRRVAIAMIRAYQLSLSMLIGRACRHLPTCSEYTAEAIDHHGLWAGGWLGLSRILRCQPFCRAGFDPVPARLPASGRWYKPWAYGRWTGRHIDAGHIHES
jgi:putative membrane protein insertion efficiency factor